MRARLVRLIVVVGVVLGVVGVPTPPASAAHFIDMWTHGSAISSGLGDPCTYPGTACPPNPTTTSGTAPDGLPVTYVSPGGTNENFAFNTAVCMQVGVHTTGGKTPVEPGLCSLAGAGVITGFCTIATASGSGFFTTFDALVTTGQSYTFDWVLTLTGLAGNQVVMQLTGTVTKSSTGETGSIRGVLHGQLLVGDCLNKTASYWSTMGDFVVRMGI